MTAIQSFIAYCRRNQWINHDPMKLVDRRRQPRDQTKAIPTRTWETLWSRRDINLREKTLWRMLYETAARAGEILGLNVEDLDLPRKRAVITAKGGHKEYVFWASGAARLLSRYLAGRRRGPVFLTHRRPNVIPARGDECPSTGRGRLSYERASVFSNRQAVGGRSTNSVTPHSPISAKPERRPCCCRPRADTKTLAHSPYTPNQETKQSQNSRPHLISNAQLGDPPRPQECEHS